MTGSADKFDWGGRRPWASVNFLTAHDGFTLNDTVSYNEKHNEANGEDNRDGNSNNLSWNCGAEGPTDDPAINELRERQKRNMLATLLLSQGLPMLVAGDEFGRTQNGNNNAYCQDNEISWVNWDIDEAGQSLMRFVSKVARIRRQFPDLAPGTLSQRHLQRRAADPRDHLADPVRHGDEPENWGDPAAKCMGMILDGRAQPTGIRKRGSDRTVLLIVNGSHAVVEFKLPEVPGGEEWRLLIDTNQPELDDEPVFLFDHEYAVTARSLLLFELRRARRMIVSEVMSREVEYIGPEASAQDAAELMGEIDVARFRWARQTVSRASSRTETSSTGSWPRGSIRRRPGSATSCPGLS